MTPEDAIFVLEHVEAHGIAEDAKKVAIQALKDIISVSMMELFEEKMKLQKKVETLEKEKEALQAVDQILIEERAKAYDN